MNATALRAGPIDCHAHVAPAEFPPSPSGSDARWPCMVCGEGGIRTVTIGDRPFRALDSRSWDAGRRVEDMDRDGLGAQVLSPMPELLSYWFDVPTAETMGDHMNSAIATMAATSPDRFRGLGMVPMQDAAAAIRGLERVASVFGLQGIEIGSNVEGAQIGDPRFDSVFEATAELGLAVFVHALHPLATRTLAPVNTPIVGFPLDTGMAAASALMAGLMTRHPKLRIGFSHGGGALGALLGRLDQGWRLTQGYSGAAAEAPSVQAQRMFYDSNVYDPAYLAHLTTVLAPGQVFLGTDYPYDIMQLDPLGYVRSAPLAAEAIASIESGAARRFLGEA